MVDATNVQPEARKPLVALARQYHFLPVALVFDLPERLCQDRNRERHDRDFGPHVIRNQQRQLRRGLRSLKREGFRHVHVLDSPERIAAVTIERTPLWNDKRGEQGPFDVIGDVHGCATELEELLALLGYAESDGAYAHPEGRRAIFVGDIVDRGPRILDSVRIVRAMVERGSAFAVPGNHDIKLVRALKGRDVQITHGLDRSLAELDAHPDERDGVASFLDRLVSHLVFEGGDLVVAHAGMKEEMQGRGSGKVRDFALYGETTGETDEFGLPVRWDWAAEYRGRAMVVYGHTPVPEPEWLNGTINIDTGCVFGGRLTALRYPEKQLVSVAAREVYAEPVKPFLSVDEPLTAQQREDELLDIEDVLGKRLIGTRLARSVTIREENAIAALEVMGRFAVDPRWLVYLPPAVSPPETSSEPGLLEHPAEAFAYYRHEGVAEVICEEKHMGSHAPWSSSHAETRTRRGGASASSTAGSASATPEPGGRSSPTRRWVSRSSTACGRSRRERTLRRACATDWLVLDCELMPWSQKAQELLRSQYAAVGAAGRGRRSPKPWPPSHSAGQARGSPRPSAREQIGDVEVTHPVYGRVPPLLLAGGVTTDRPQAGAVPPARPSEGAVHVDEASHSWHLERIGASSPRAAGTASCCAGRRVSGDRHHRSRQRGSGGRVVRDRA